MVKNTKGYRRRVVSIIATKYFLFICLLHRSLHV